MTTTLGSQCLSCERFRSPLDSDEYGERTCDAFVEGIPEEIWSNLADHRREFLGDDGILWSSNGREFPDYAMAKAEPPGSEVQAAGKPDGDDDQLRDYWTKGEGLAKWANSAHPWTALVRHLTRHVGRERAERIASQWFHLVFGLWPGERKGKNPAGPG